MNRDNNYYEIGLKYVTISPSTGGLLFAPGLTAQCKNLCWNNLTGKRPRIKLVQSLVD